MKRHVIALMVVASACVLEAATQVTTREVAIRREPDKLSRAVAKAPANASLEVLEQKQDFIRVRYQQTEGWVRLAELSEKDRKAFVGSDRASAVQEASASKGLDEATLAFGRSAGLNPTALRNLQARRQQLIDSGRFEQFAAEGKVGAR